MRPNVPGCVARDRDAREFLPNRAVESSDNPVYAPRIRISGSKFVFQAQVEHALFQFGLRGIETDDIADVGVTRLLIE